MADMDDSEELELGGQVTHCGQPMAVKGRRLSWSGENEIQTVRLRCGACDATAVLTVTTPVGPPEASRG